MNIYSNSLLPTPNIEQAPASLRPAAHSELPKDGTVIATPTQTIDEAALREAAENFETAFIAQMLKFSGLTEALTSSGGESVAAFTDFYIESFAEDIVEGGGFGLADKFYEKLKLQSQDIRPDTLDISKD